MNPDPVRISEAYLATLPDDKRAALQKVLQVHRNNMPADDLDLDVIGRLVGSITPRKWIEIYEDARRR
jgi:hypothetical protein